ncbi:MAG: hypothetical protein HIU87_02850 [Acidobacteria bacterium]|nr:hypothetical protein [Acidobacteriota bacterium]
MHRFTMVRASDEVEKPVDRNSSNSVAHMRIDTASLLENYDRVPFGFEHDLHTLPMFQPEALERLARRFTDAGRGYFIAQSAPAPGTPFYSVPYGGFTPSHALENLDQFPLRILLKRPENVEPAFRELLDTLFSQVTEMRGGLGNEQVMRLESAVFISAAAATTPIHFDPEIAFFSQIEGLKEYHVYSPADAREQELERFYIRGVIDIGRLEMAQRDATREQVFHLQPGMGFHQPQNSPHWVRTAGARSVSYSFVYQTDATRRLGRVRAFNHYERLFGMKPAPPGVHPWVDKAKAEAMQGVIPIRKAVGTVLSKVRREA